MGREEKRAACAREGREWQDRGRADERMLGNEEEGVVSSLRKWNYRTVKAALCMKSRRGETAREELESQRAMAVRSLCPPLWSSPPVSFRATLPLPFYSPLSLNKWIFARSLPELCVPSGVQRLQHDQECDFADPTVCFLRVKVEIRRRPFRRLSHLPSVALTRVLNDIRRDFKVNLANFSVYSLYSLFLLFF